MRLVLRWWMMSMSAVALLWQRARRRPRDVGAISRAPGLVDAEERGEMVNGLPAELVGDRMDVDDGGRTLVVRGPDPPAGVDAIHQMIMQPPLPGSSSRTQDAQTGVLLFFAEVPFLSCLAATL